MAQQVEINIPIFERNLKLSNKKGLRRTFTSVVNHPQEYLEIPTLSSSTDVVLQVTLDKGNVVEFENSIKDKGYTVLGSVNTFHMEKLLADYEKHKEVFSKEAERMEGLKAEVEKYKSECKDFAEIENDDAVFYFLPFKSDVKNLHDWIHLEHDSILAYAKEKDITIMIRVVGFTNQLDGFFGFNFFDADQKEEVVVEFASRNNVVTDIKNVAAVYNAALHLTSLGASKEDLADPLLNVHLVAENIRYVKA